jgi:hypothetical protein
MDDDENAVTAWCQYMPANTKEMGQSAVDVQDKTDSVSTESEGQAAAGADLNSEARSPLMSSSNDDTSVEQAKDGAAEPEIEPGKALKATLGNNCDGYYDKHWTFADDIFVCKDCLDVQFDAGCYRKLKAGELDIAICSADHEHIHVPTFNEEAWRSAPKGYVTVGGKQMSRVDWIDGIKKYWKIDELSLKQADDASKRIQRAWRSYRFLRLARRRS